MRESLQMMRGLSVTVLAYVAGHIFDAKGTGEVFTIFNQ